jgi:hypothetical protein
MDARSAHVPLTLVGGFARRVLAAEPAWRVLQVFRRSFYCRSVRGSLVLVGPAALGAGPLHALWGGPAEPELPDIGAAVGVDGDPCPTPRASLTLGLREAREWRPPAPPAWTPAALRRSLDWLGGAAERAPAEGVGRLIGRIVSGQGTAADIPSGQPILARHAWPGLAALSGWVHRALAPARVAAGAPPDAVASLIGLGPGLTPSGDDALAGALLALHAVSRGDVAETLGAWLRPRAEGRTGLVSLAHLQRAARGEGAAVLHDALAALASGAEAALGAVPTAVGRLGHSSGWDGLAGIAAVNAAWLDVAESGGRLRPACR